ncbi:MAG: hypothetical protein WAR77_11530 [Saprospiraceae bacterium]|nr:hypothetical protein [Saprospiraceae bacterium]MBK8450311.1 hypothetical protein [Saprospiraceae bacterium]MBK9727124.1 hypothetical protein [Saprospiraceae bacterium]
MGDELLPEYSEQFLENQDLENQWIQSIKLRVEELLEKDPGLLFSHLYRLDVDEGILKNILSSESSVNLSEAISREIWKRQKSRIISRKNNPQNIMLDPDYF